MNSNQNFGSYIIAIQVNFTLTRIISPPVWYFIADQTYVTTRFICTKLRSFKPVIILGGRFT